MYISIIPEKTIETLRILSVEYKSPTDYFSIDDYYKVRAYAYLYKVLAKKRTQ